MKYLLLICSILGFSYVYAELPGQVKDIPTQSNLEYLDDKVSNFVAPSFTKERIVNKLGVLGGLIVCSNCATPYTVCVGTKTTNGGWSKLNTTTACQ